MTLPWVLLAGALLANGGADHAWSQKEVQAKRAAENQALIEKMAAVQGLTPEQVTAVRALFEHSARMGQGNPAITEHAMSPAECEQRRAAASPEQGRGAATLDAEDRRYDALCGAPYMAPLYDPATQKAEDATACIDRFEFPNVPCTYPVVWIQASEAAKMCEAVGKRLCDAHEWEGACAGAVLPPDYPFALARGKSPNDAVKSMRHAYNRKWEPTKNWSYGPEYKKGVCATSSFKHKACNGGAWNDCGSNTFPVGSFPTCRSPLGVYDLNGNAAEHMNLPLAEDELASRGSTKLGVVEMKGSWFVFDRIYAHEDWCRWRAPYWHGTRVRAADSHLNYHLGFRCCKDVHRAQ